MKGVSRIFTTVAVTAIAIIPFATITASGGNATPQAPAPHDTTTLSATKSLIESVGELSRTAEKLSKTALKLLEAHEETERRQAGEQQKKAYVETPPVETPPAHADVKSGAPEKPGVTEKADTTEDATPKVFIGEDNPREIELLWDHPQEENTGGRYIWVPDDKAGIVESALNGTIPAQTSYGNSAPDLSEMTYWRGDSIPMAIPTKRLGRYDRKLYNWLIYPKGLWHIGLSANYGELSTDDSEFLSLIDDVDLGGTIYSIKPSVSYFFSNNLCAGLRLAYTKGKMDVNSFNVEIDDDISFNLNDISYLSESYSAAVYLQQYFGLSRRGRFAVYNEIELEVGTGNTHFTRPFDGDIRETRTKTQRLNINYSPGVSVMVMKNAGINLSFGVFGFHMRKDRQWENGEQSGDRLTSGINFKFNIFNINFGVCVII